MAGKVGMKGSGGARPGAGRSLKYGEKTKKIISFVPLSSVESFEKMTGKFLGDCLKRSQKKQQKTQVK